MSVFHGTTLHQPREIRDALGCLETNEDGALLKLVGAVMTLCITVSELQKEIEQLKRAKAE